MRHLLLAGAAACAVAIAAPARAQTTIWSQPAGVTDVSSLLRVNYPTPYEWGITYFMQYNKCAGNLPDVRIGSWNLSTYTSIGSAWTPLATYQIGCHENKYTANNAPGAAWETATQANGGEIGYIADNTSITPPNTGGDFWLAYGWTPGAGGSSLPALGTTLAAIFSADAKVPWDWSGKLVNGSWKTVTTLPFGMGGYQNFQLVLFDKTKALSAPYSTFYFIINTYDSRGAGFGNPADQVNNCNAVNTQIIANFGANGSYSTIYGTSATYQTVSWSGYKTFTWSITPAQIEQLARDINTACATTPGFTSFSTHATDYGINNIFWGTELNLWGIGPGGTCPCPYGYSQAGALRNAKLMTQ